MQIPYDMIKLSLLIYFQQSLLEKQVKILEYTSDDVITSNQP